MEFHRALTHTNERISFLVEIVVDQFVDFLWRTKEKEPIILTFRMIYNRVSLVLLGSERMEYENRSDNYCIPCLDQYPYREIQAMDDLYYRNRNYRRFTRIC